MGVVGSRLAIYRLVGSALRRKEAGLAPRAIWPFAAQKTQWPCLPPDLLVCWQQRLLAGLDGRLSQGAALGLQLGDGGVKPGW
jgi:hypothetical protein